MGVMKRLVPQGPRLRHLMVNQVLLSLLKGENVLNVEQLGTSSETAQMLQSKNLLRKLHLKQFIHNVDQFHLKMINEL
ncbi:hypothetical protein Hanom_Chr11g01061591 [Helianthus anomalus]